MKCTENRQKAGSFEPNRRMVCGYFYNRRTIGPGKTNGASPSTSQHILDGTTMNHQDSETTGTESPAKPDVCRPTGSADLPMLDVYMPMMKSSAIVAAVRLGLFEALADGPLSAETLAVKAGAQVAGVRALADFLESIGYLESIHGGSDCCNSDPQVNADKDVQSRRYANAASTQRWFTRQGQVDYSAGALWTFEAWSMMGELDKAVRDGAPGKTLWERMRDEPRLGPLFSRYMNAFARHVSPDLVAHVPVTADQTRLLDLGGSHGLHSIGFCHAHPQLNAVIVDMPQALIDTPDTIARAGMRERITLQPGNLLDLAWANPQGDQRLDAQTAHAPGSHAGDNKFDLALYLCVAHNQSAQDNARVIGQIRRALRPGGMLVIHDYLATDPLNAFHAAFRLTLLYETGTRTYSEQEYREWLNAAGFARVDRIDLDPLEKGSLLLARV